MPFGVHLEATCLRCLFFFPWEVRTVQHPFALELSLNASQSPLILRGRIKETAILSFVFAIPVGLGYKVQWKDHSSSFVSLSEPERRDKFYILNIFPFSKLLLHKKSMVAHESDLQDFS